MEQRRDPDGDRIHRPRQVYTGETIREFEDRGTKRLPTS
jgi:citrate synthase